MIRFENEIVYFNGFKHITITREEYNLCYLCKMNYSQCCYESVVMDCVIKFSGVGLRTLNI